MPRESAADRPDGDSSDSGEESDYVVRLDPSSAVGQFVIAKEKEVTKIERVCPLPRSPRSEERADGERQDGEVVTKALRLKTESGRMAKQQVRDSNTAIGTARRGAKRTSRPLSFVSHAC